MKWSLLCNPTIKWPHNKKECVLANIKFKYINLKIKRIINNNYHWILILFTPNYNGEITHYFYFHYRINYRSILWVCSIGYNTARSIGRPSIFAYIMNSIFI